MESRWFNPMSRPAMANLYNTDDRSDKDLMNTWSLRPQERQKLAARKRHRDCHITCFATIVILQLFIAAGVSFLVWSSIDTSSKLTLRAGTAEICGSQPCRNGGECFEGSDDFICNCGEAWSGKTCETGT
ncbi:uncharacterized protein LOC144927400 [Branchiostoma floridae x Branchiostoma belcheri]